MTMTMNLDIVTDNEDGEDKDDRLSGLFEGLPDLITDDEDVEDNEGDDDGPPGLLPTDDEDHEYDEVEEEDPIFLRYCLTCVYQCVCTVNLASSSEDLLVGKVWIPSPALKKGRIS